MGDEARKQQDERDAAAIEPSLPLFDHLSKGQGTPTGESNPESEESASETDREANESGTTASIPIPAFLAGAHEYANEVKAFIEPVSHLSEKTTEDAKTSDETASDEQSAEVEATDLQELNEESGNGPVEEPAEEQTEAPAEKETEVGDVFLDKAESLEPTPPARKEIRIWPWLVVILLIISGVGFWYKQDAWLDHPWVRSVLINLHLPVTVRDKDWVIVPESVQGNWLKRDDGSQVLIIQGRIENLLYCELSPPKILVRFFDESGITESLEERIMSITEPPSMEKVKHAPFVTPGLDRVAVEAQGQRGFFLVLESLPEQAADFTLNPVAN